MLLSCVPLPFSPLVPAILVLITALFNELFALESPRSKAYPSDE